MIGKMLNRFLHNGLGGREGAASQLERGQQWGLHITLGVLYVFCVFFFLSCCALCLSLLLPPPLLSRVGDVDLLLSESLWTSLWTLFPWPSQMG